MKRKLSLLSLITLSFSALFAETEPQPQQPKQDDIPLRVKLDRQQAPAKSNRTPAKPIYGEFANQVLYLCLDETSESSYVLTISKEGAAVENATLSSAELICGYTVSASVPFTVELTTENNVTYVGEISE